MKPIDAPVIEGDVDLELSLQDTASQIEIKSIECISIDDDDLEEKCRALDATPIDIISNGNISEVLSLGNANNSAKSKQVGYFYLAQVGYHS